MSPTPEPPDPPSQPPRFARRLAFALVVAWAASLALACARKYHAFLYTDFDLAIFSQALLGLRHGRWFSSIRGMYWLGDHSSLSLLLLAPLAALWRSPLLLTTVQALALAAGAWPLHAYARRRLGDGTAAALFALAWVFQPALGYLALFEFHPETLATAALLGTAAALAARRTRGAAALALLAALAKEDAALPLAVLGATAALAPRGGRRAAGLALLAIAAGSLALSFGILKPALAQRGAEYGAMYAAWGHGARGIAAGLARHPFAALAAFVATPGDPTDTAAKLQCWLHLLTPVLATALLAPLSLLPALPIFAEHFLSYRVEQHTVFYQYTALSLPFIALAAVDGVARLARRGDPAGTPARARSWTMAVLGAALVSELLFGPFAPHPLLVRGIEPAERVWPTGEDRARAAGRSALQAELPAYGELVVDFPSLAPLAARDSLHSLHHVAAGRFTFSSRPYPAPAHPAALLADLSELAESGELDAGQLRRVQAFAATRELHVHALAGDLAMLTPGRTDTLAWLVPAPDAGSHALRFDGALELLGATIQPDSAAAASVAAPLRIRTRWRRVGALPGWPQVQWIATDDRGIVHEATPRLLGYGWSDPAAWPAGAAFEERYAWLVPPTLEPGEFTLALSVSWRAGEREWDARCDDPAARAADGVIPIGRFRVVR